MFRFPRPSSPVPLFVVAAALGAASAARAGTPESPDASAVAMPATSSNAAPVSPGAPAPDVLTLEQVLERAEASCLDVQLLDEKLAQAEVQVGKAWSALLPTLQAVGSYTRNSVAAVIPFPDFRAGFGPNPQQPPDPDNLADLRVYPLSLLDIEVQPQDQWVGVGQASIPVFLAPAYEGIAAARAALRLTEKSVAHARNEIFFAIAQLYYGAVATTRVVELAEHQLDGARESERVAKGRYDAGDLTRVGYLRAGVERAKAEQDLRRAQNAHAATQIVLATLTGIDEPFAVTAPTPVEAPSGRAQALIDEALATRADVAAAHEAVGVADHGLMATWWTFAPIIAINGAYRWANFAGFSGSDRTWAVTVNAVWTLYDGGLRHERIREATSHKREAELRLRKLERQVTQEVETSTLDLASARANLVKAEEQNQLASDAAATVQVAFRAGSAAYLDVVDAQNAAFAAGVGKVTEELNVQVAALRLAKAIGKLERGRVVH